MKPERDINGMRAQQWQAKDTSLTEKARDDNKSKVTDSKLSKLYEALAEVIITSVKDSYGTSADKKYIYQTDMLMSRVRKALTEKLSDLQIDSIKQLVIDNTKQQAELLSKMLLNAFSTLSVKIDKNAQAKLVEKIAVVVDKLLKAHVAKLQSEKSSSKSESKDKKKNDALTEIVRALKSSSKSQSTQKAKEAELKKYQSKAYKLISKTLDAVNQNHTIAIQSMTAGFKRTTETISNEVSSLQDKIEDTNSSSSIMSLIPQLKNASAIAKFANPMSWFKSFVVKPMKLLFSGLWNFLLKPMFYVGKFLLKPIGYLVKGIWDNFIKKPIAKLIELTGNVLGAVTSAATTALSVFFLTPKGAYMLGYAIGYVWSRWIEPIAMPMLKFLEDKVLPIAKKIADGLFDAIISVMERVGKPLLEWIKGESSFNDAMKKVIFGDDIYEKDAKGNVLKDKDGKKITKTWTELLKTTFITVVDNLLENHPIIRKLVKFTVDHPLITAIGAYLGVTAAANPYSLVSGIGGLLKFVITNPEVAAVISTYAAGFWMGNKIYKWLEKKADEAGIRSDVSLTKLDKHVSDTYKAHLGEIAEATKENYVPTMTYARDGQNAEQLFAEYEKLKEWLNVAKADIKMHGYKFDGTIGKYYLTDVDFKQHPQQTIYNMPSSKDEAFGLYEQAKLRMKELETQYGLTESDFEAPNGKEEAVARLKRLFEARVDNAINASVFSKHKYAEQQAKVDEMLGLLTPQSDLQLFQPVEVSTSAPVAKAQAAEKKAEQPKLPVEVSTSAPNAMQTQYSIEKTIDDLLMPLGTAAYLVRMQNDRFEEVKKELIREESAKQISQIARSANIKVAEQSAKLSGKEYKDALDAMLDAYEIDRTKYSVIDNEKLNKMMKEEAKDNLDAFMKRLNTMETNLIQMYIKEGKSQSEAKHAAFFITDNIRKTYDIPMNTKDR